MGMMLLRIKTFFHASNPLVYSIFPTSILKLLNVALEENDQALFVAR